VNTCYGLCRPTFILSNAASEFLRFSHAPITFFQTLIKKKKKKKNKKARKRKKKKKKEEEKR
jgi:Na+/phosphate symporter